VIAAPAPATSGAVQSGSVTAAEAPSAKVAKKAAHRSTTSSAKHHAHRSTKKNSAKTSKSSAKKAASVARHPKKHSTKPKLAK